MTRRLMLALSVVVSVIAVAVATMGVGAAPAGARVIDQAGKPLTCPDPSVVDAHTGRYRYYLVCTSDFAADAFPIRGSNDLVHWRAVGYVFPKGKQPWWAEPSPVGRFWAPAIYRIGNRWVVYFAASYGGGIDGAVLHTRTPARGEMVIGVATAASITGPWHTELLHYRGQFDRRGGERETYGGVIDPSVVRDPRDGQLYLFWAEQHSSIWVTRLSSDGLKLDPAVHQVLWTQPGWECATPRKTCVIEGPEEYYRDGWFYLFFSGASTWTGTYAIGAAVSDDPLTSRFQPLSPDPVLSSGQRWIGPGGCSAPVVGPDGNTYIFYHAEEKPDTDHDSADRFLLVGQIAWGGVGGYFPVINHGAAG